MKTRTSVCSTGVGPGKHAGRPLPFSPDKGGGPVIGTAGAGEGGFILIGALLILVLLVLIGIAATTTTTLELQVAGVERIHKETFYLADGGTELGTLVLEENISCPEGFTAAVLNGNVEVRTLNLWMNAPPVPHPSDASENDVWAFRYPFNHAAGERRINFTVGGETQLAVGGALQMAAGYMGKGKGAAGGGGSLFYDLYAQAIGRSDSESLLHIQWRHVIGQEGGCNY